MTDLPKIPLTGVAWKDVRDAALLEFLGRSPELRGGTWLDVGACDGLVSRQIAEILGSSHYVCVDVRPRAARTRPFDGKRLEFAERSFDFVLFNWVLHHAADHTIPLLRDAARIARQYVIVAEDLKETGQDCQNAVQHDIRGTFRGDKEWREVFSLLGLECVASLDVPSRLAADAYEVTRRLYVLKPPVPSVPSTAPLLAEVSPGELIDRITILEIKAARIGDPAKRARVLYALERLSEVREQRLPSNAVLDGHRAELKRLNEALWDVENALRACEAAGDFGSDFVALARSVYRTNDARARTKKAIDQLYDSELTEEKSYAEY